MPDNIQLKARCVALRILEGFGRHYRDFSAYNQSARTRFERADWKEERADANNRSELYDQHILHTIQALKDFNIGSFDSDLWEQVKLIYMGSLYEHKQPELAETFYNSVFTHLYHRSYFNSTHIFIRPSISTEYIDYLNSVSTILAAELSLEDTFIKLMSRFEFSVDYINKRLDVQRLVTQFSRCFRRLYRKNTHPVKFYLLTVPLYRNKSAYIVGHVVFSASSTHHPFVIVLRNDDALGIYVDALLVGDDVHRLFSFSWDEFMVPTETPSAVVRFLLEVLPSKKQADIYTLFGLRKQGKNDFYRNFLQHIGRTQEPFTIAPGTLGMVMTVFTLPTFPYVFKVINDRFAHQKSISREQVKRKYRLVKRHDRIGRMADSHEFSHVAFPIARFAPDLLSYIQEKMPSSISIEGDMLIVSHLYAEISLTPLDLYLQQADDRQIVSAIVDYGQAIKDLMAVNIFPGDLLFKNFGVNSRGQVIFYDYDEIELVTDCNFRKIPPPRNMDDEFSSEPWYSVSPNDVFPEEFAFFLLADPKVKKIFMKYHADLLDSNYWKQVQESIKRQKYPDLFAYSAKKRFSVIFQED